MIDKTKESMNWLLGQAKTSNEYRKIILHNTDRWRDSVVIGKLYFFSYDPKTKDKLPIYDKFPLVFPIEYQGGGKFLGLNIHYLSVGERQLLLDRLHEYRTNTRIPERTRLKLSYDLLSASKNLNSLARPCIKSYLFSHVRSRFIEIQSTEWKYAINLPVQQFVTRK